MSDDRATCPDAPGQSCSQMLGIGGVLRAVPEDFLVEEVPMYEPQGTGEHRYLFIEKRQLPTLDVVGRIARHLGVRRRDVGYAGLKDKHAVTRQWISIYDTHAKNTDLNDLPDDRITILRDTRHSNKLRRGHLKANRFSITVRDAVGTATQARDTLDLLERQGIPNRAGTQRFGLHGNNHLVGRALIKRDADAFARELLGPGDPDRFDHEARMLFSQGEYQKAINAFPRTARSECIVLKALLDGLVGDALFKRIDETQRMFWVSAFQSAVFNRMLDQRLQDGTLDRLEQGDVASVLREGKAGPCFLVDAASANDPDTQSRVDSFELSPAGPLWGPKMLRAHNATDARELDALGELGLSVEEVMSFARGESERLMPGDRRPMRIPVRETSVEAGHDDRGTFIRCGFTLPPGAYATVVMDELMKPGNAHG